MLFRHHCVRFFLSERFALAFFTPLCYTVGATQLNRFVYMGLFFLSYGKNANSLSAFSCKRTEVVSQQSE